MQQNFQEQTISNVHIWIFSVKIFKKLCINLKKHLKSVNFKNQVWMEPLPIGFEKGLFQDSKRGIPLGKGSKKKVWNFPYFPKPIQKIKITWSKNHFLAKISILTKNYFFPLKKSKIHRKISRSGKSSSHLDFRNISVRPSPYWKK